MELLSKPLRLEAAFLSNLIGTSGTSALPKTKGVLVNRGFVRMVESFPIHLSALDAAQFFESGDDFRGPLRHFFFTQRALQRLVLGAQQD